MQWDRFDKMLVQSRPKVLAIHLELLQYPILADRIRQRMRDEMFTRSIMDMAAFESEVREKAIQSQKRELLVDPMSQETEEVWQRRKSRIRDILTEFYYAMNFSHQDFLRIVEGVLSNKKPSGEGVFLSINPEIAPWKMLFEQARQIKVSSPEKQQERRHHLQEIIVVLTKGMLSDHLSFVGIAKSTFSIEDLEWVYKRRIGRGKIGGKAGGMMLAKSIMHRAEPDDPVDFRQVVTIPDSFFVGSDVMYDFLEANSLGDTVNLKYKSHQELMEEHAGLVNRFMRARIPEPFVSRLRRLLQEMGRSPIIVRSSSLLEDNFGISFAGKYDSFFCPNQGNIDDNLEDLCSAIKRVYASVLSPDAMAYRQQKGLIDYDERMAVLIQRVVGQRFGDYHFPVVAGVGFSYNPFQWNPRIDREAGFLRIVTGMGTRAVDRLSSDYAQMVALSHPTLRPVKSPQEVIQYSQKRMDVINLESNRMETREVSDLLDTSFPFLKYIGSIERDGDLHPVLIRGPGTLSGRVVITHGGLLKNRRFVEVMRAMLLKLARHYGKPVDVEFIVELSPGSELDFRIQLLQCRQQSLRLADQETEIPEDISHDDILMVSQRMVSSGRVGAIRYVVYVDPEHYQNRDDVETRHKLGRVIGQLNTALEGEVFILVGPGRWGSSNIDLGVPVSYGDIYNARVLVEIALPHGDAAPEASYGTHFFQDLVESDIYPLPIYPTEQGALLNYDFFRSAENVLAGLLPDAAPMAEHLKVIDLELAACGRRLEVIMNAREMRAVGFLTAP